MKKLCALLFCCLMVGLAVSSCDRTTTDSSYTTTTTDLVTEKFKGIDYFPNKVGNQWTYRVYNWAAQQWETATVTVIGHDIIELETPQVVAVWEAVWDYKTETLYVAQRGDSVLIYPAGSIYPVAKYIFPLEDGATWTYRHAYGQATTTIYALDTCSSCTEMYNYCFRYYTRVEGIVFEDESIYWGYLAPQVGMVRGSRAEEFNYSMINYDNWELLDYERVTGPR